MNTIERRYCDRVRGHWESGTPGFRLQAYLGGRKRIDLALGETYSYYDWASVTKIVFSATAMMNLVDEKKLRLNDPVMDDLSWFRSPAPRTHWRIRDLLTHSAGLTWWKPFFQDLDLKLSRDDRWRQLEKLMAREMASHARKKAAYNGKSVYSDLDLLTLGSLMRLKTGQSFDQIWDRLRDRLALPETRFHVGNRPPHPRRLYAPTERCVWRGKIIQGEVHDENTWALGGVAPHSGLFGPIDELSRWGLLLRRSLLQVEGGTHLARPETVRRFARRQVPRATGDWGFGIMLPTRGSASCGRYFSTRSVGHLGFTGTSLWFDPRRDLLVTILSNRVHPTRENKIFPQLRPFLHNCVVECLSES